MNLSCRDEGREKEVEKVEEEQKEEREGDEPHAQSFPQANGILGECPDLGRKNRSR